MLTKVKRLYKQARSRVANLRAVEVSKLREKISNLTDEVEAKYLELQTMPGLVAETAMLWEGAGKFCDVAKNGEGNVAVLNSLQEEVLAVKKDVAK